MRRYAAEVDSSSIAKSPFIFSFRNGATSHTFWRRHGSMTEFQRMGDPAALGAAVAFLASSDSSFMTASEVAVDGGLAQL